MKINEKIYTPRFCTVKINAIFDNKQDAYANGYKEPTHYHKDGFTILGKSIDMYHMLFAAVAEQI